LVFFLSATGFVNPALATEQHGSIITQQFNVTLTTVIFGRIHEGSDSGRAAQPPRAGEISTGNGCTVQYAIVTSYS
jgi:hypothetical protein